VLLHHIDVVPTVPSEWTKPPFGGVQSGGYIWARGALDMKSIGIAELMAVADLKRRKVPLDATSSISAWPTKNSAVCTVAKSCWRRILSFSPTWDSF